MALGSYRLTNLAEQAVILDDREVGEAVNASFIMERSLKSR